MHARISILRDDVVSTKEFRRWTQRVSFAVAVITLGLPVDTVERIFALGFALEQLRQNFRDLERCVMEATRWR
jgi:hypothetical protein